MKFGEKLRLARTSAKMTQADLADKLGLAKRTVEGYESGAFYPRKRKVYDELAQIFGVEKNWFLTESEGDKQTTAQDDMKKALETVTSLYSGGRLSEEDKDALAKALMEAYFIAKAKKAK
ncbi:MAG: helix-turn-helix transcriptional regulator [Clostridia bacterium]|nr:helix-turn-helix transcriptional regulator [Clostridia bacterium]